jgi:uncharacterized protein
VEIVTDFTIPSPPDEAYRFLLEVDRVAPCVPGGELGPRCADGSYPAKVTVRLGPMRLVYAGSLSIAEQDDSERRAVLRAAARESAGQGTVDATMTMRVTPNGSGSRVDVLTELTLTGRAARMGRGLVEDVAARFVTDMASCLERELAGGDRTEEESVPTVAPPPARPVSAVKLLVRVLLDRLRGVESRGES